MIKKKRERERERCNLLLLLLDAFASFASHVCAWTQWEAQVEQPYAKSEHSLKASVFFFFFDFIVCLFLVPAALHRSVAFLFIILSCSARGIH